MEVLPFSCMQEEFPEQGAGGTTDFREAAHAYMMEDFSQVVLGGGYFRQIFQYDAGEAGHVGAMVAVADGVIQMVKLFLVGNDVLAHCFQCGQHIFFSNHSVYPP